MKNFLLATLLATFATGAFAHSDIKSIIPANNTTIESVPEEVVINFSKKTRITKITMTHMTHPSVDLDIDGLKKFIKTATVPMEAMGAGTYKFEWRGLGQDGHAMKGEFMFEVAE
ncbi:MAG TPA: copper resistance protein CopC [Rhodobacteraceae bacterium]|nr:copper resistance protein CopC [Paracoccaceae bacterium]